MGIHLDRHLWDGSVTTFYRFVPLSIHVTDSPYETFHSWTKTWKDTRCNQWTKVKVCIFPKAYLKKFDTYSGFLLTWNQYKIYKTHLLLKLSFCFHLSNDLLQRFLRVDFQNIFVFKHFFSWFIGVLEE